MKEAIANAGIFNLVIIFVIILIAFFIGSLSYSKAFKVKNKIIEEIEKDQEYTTGVNNSTEDRVEEWIENIGYRVNTGNTRNSEGCPTVTGNGGEQGKLVNSDGDYQYCVYEFDTCTAKSDKAKCGRYYRVTAYMYFDVPILNGLLRIPVSGETMIFNEIDS